MYIGITCGEFSKSFFLSEKQRKEAEKHNKSLNFNVEKVFFIFAAEKRGFCAMRTIFLLALIKHSKSSAERENFLPLFLAYIKKYIK